MTVGVSGFKGLSKPNRSRVRLRPPEEIPTLFLFNWEEENEGEGPGFDKGGETTPTFIEAESGISGAVDKSSRGSSCRGQ